MPAKWFFSTEEKAEWTVFLFSVAPFKARTQLSSKCGYRCTVWPGLCVWIDFQLAVNLSGASPQWCLSHGAATEASQWLKMFLGRGKTWRATALTSRSGAFKKTDSCWSREKRSAWENGWSCFVPKTPLLYPVVSDFMPLESKPGQH